MLFHQFSVDMGSKMEGKPLKYAKHLQSLLCPDSYIHLPDDIADESNPNEPDEKAFLPATVTDSVHATSISDHKTQHFMCLSEINLQSFMA